jgi:SAM-dependent methyltransferase
MSPEDPAANGTTPPALYERPITPFGGHDWTYSRDYIGWLVMNIARRLRVAWTDVAAEFGVGIERYRRILSARGLAVACVDTAASALATIRGQEGLIPVQASARDVAVGRVRLPHDGYDVMLVRHLDHAGDPAEVIAGLASLLRPGGRLLVVMRPPVIGCPLFAAALDVFAGLQPDPERTAAAMRAAGLDTELSYEGYQLTFSTRKWLLMVGERSMRFLSHFDDAQMEAGLAEIRQAHPGTRVGFEDTYAFILGTAP